MGKSLVGITYVKEHIREVGECDVHVSAYFRLTNSKINPHAGGCRCITENEIKDIYAECSNEEDLMTKDGESYIEKTKTNAGNRVLPMSDEVYEAFKRVISSRKKQKIEKIINGYSGFLFLNDKGNPMLAYHWEKKFQYSVEKYNKIYKEELPNITPHVCRHTYCSKMAKSGISVKTLQYLMGHSDVQTTLNIYTHLKLEDAKNDLEKIKIREEIQKEMSVIDMAEAKQALARVKGL